MNLRLDDEDSALLKALAEAEHVSLHEAALRAIRRSARGLAHTDRVREATAEMLDRWGGGSGQARPRVSDPAPGKHPRDSSPKISWI